MAAGWGKETSRPMMLVFNLTNGGDLGFIESVVDSQAFDVFLPLFLCMPASPEMSEKNEGNTRKNCQTP